MKYQRTTGFALGVGLVVVAVVASIVLADPLGAVQAQWRRFDAHAPETHLQTAIGNFIDAEALHKFGRNPVIDMAAAEDIWAVGGDYTFPAAAETVAVVSTDADDDGAPVGAGARTLTVIGLDGDYLEVSETITLNGVGAVTTTQTFLRVFRAFVATVGATGSNAGVVSATNSVSGDDLFSIAIGTGQTTLGVYTVPDGKTLLLVRVYGSIGKQTAGAGTLEVIVRSEGGAFRTIQYVGFHSTGTTLADVFFPVPLAIAARTDIKLRAGVSANNSDINAGFDGYLVTQ